MKDPVDLIRMDTLIRRIANAKEVSQEAKEELVKLRHSLQDDDDCEVFYKFAKQVASDRGILPEMNEILEPFQGS